MKNNADQKRAIRKKRKDFLYIHHFIKQYVNVLDLKFSTTFSELNRMTIGKVILFDNIRIEYLQFAKQEGNYLLKVNINLRLSDANK